MVIPFLISDVSMATDKAVELRESNDGTTNAWQVQAINRDNTAVRIKYILIVECLPYGY